MYQEQEDGVERPCVIAHKTFNPDQRGWCPAERECYALIWALHHKLRAYVIAHDNVIVYTDHKPLLGIFKKASTNAKLRRWAAILSMYKFNLVYRCGVDMGPAMLSKVPQRVPMKTIVGGREHKIAIQSLGPCPRDPSRSSWCRTSQTVLLWWESRSFSTSSTPFAFILFLRCVFRQHSPL